MPGIPPPPAGIVLDDDIPAPPAGVTLDDPEATDGDTIRAQEQRIRLWGIDAPELSQRGYDRKGNPVPIGEQSRDWLAQEIEDGAQLDRVEGTSYGRTVGPVSTDEGDIGLHSLRSGNAIAAPEYIRNDPQRRFDYMEAERLARLNGLGPMNDTAAQVPSDYRKQGQLAARELVPVFWDTPTPFNGMRPEAERQYVELLRSGNAQEIFDFATAQGLGMDRAEVEAWVADRDKRIAQGQPFEAYPNYQRGPETIIETGDGAVNAGIRGYSEGFVAGGLGELGAVADTLGGTPGRENVWNSDRRLADIWANNEYQNEAILRGDEHAHPTASTVGEVGGALTSAFVVPYGQGARTVPQLARVGAAYGGAEGFLGTDGGVTDRLKGAVVGAPAGAITNAVGGKVLELVAPRLGSAVRSVRDRLTGRATAAPEAAAETIPPPQLMVDHQAAAPSLSQELPRPTRLDEPLTDAQRRAAAANVQPRDVVPLPANTVGGVEEAIAKDTGRLAEVHAPDERKLLTRRTYRAWNGSEVAKVGPTDMIGWLRLRGGLQDQGGELSAMDMTNAARRGLDFVGQETRFGPLVHQDGATLDDAAEAAWEAGFFPELTERPDINTFLDALRETYEGGRGRRFLPDDVPELQDFYSARADRHAVEQRQEEVGGPVYEDASSPPDTPQPFPPVEAYEEWPSAAIERVGNIDVSRLDTPQDIARALKTTHAAMGGFDAATRGRITHAETERLAGDLNMTPEQLMARRKGQAMNAEEALAARRILAKSGNELVNAARSIQRMDDPGEELLAEFRHKWMRHAAIQEQVAGATAEAGRALQQFRMGADSNAVRTDVLGALVRAGGGKQGLKDAADVLLDAVELGPGKFNAMVEKAAKPKWRDKVSELYVNFLLSNPPTHVVNMVSNTLTALAQIPEYATASAIGGARRLVMRKALEDRVLASEVGARTIGLVQGAKEGARLFARSLRSGEADDFVSKVEGEEFKAISGLKGEVIRVPTRLLTAEDQFFKGVARRMELNAQAVRIAHSQGLKGDAAKQRIAELVSNPTDAMLERAMDYGRYLTFQRKLGEFGQGLSRITSGSLPAKVVIPFVRTPINLMKFAMERSPAAPLLKEWRRDFLAGGEKRDLAAAKMLLGTGFATAMYQAALDGRITGGLPPDPAKARLLYADGWQPYSIKIGDRYISYSRLDPLSTTIGVAADMATLPGGLSDRQKDDQATMLVASIMGNLASKTWLSGVSSFVEALDDPGRSADRWTQRVVSAFAVPAGVAGVANAIDPIARKRESIGEAIQARTPGLSDNLLPRRDIFGRPIENDSLGPDFVSPFWQSQAKNDPVVAEMLRIGKSLSAPGKQYTEDGERIDYTPEEYDRYHELAGRFTYNNLLALVGSAPYSRLDDDARRRAATKAIRDARKSAREVLHDPAYPRSDAATPAGSDIPAPPEGIVLDDREKGDPLHDLETAIPGLRVTSGFRDSQYQAEMRTRGYHPAPNSAHLDGDSIDVTPPAGMSMGALAGTIRRIRPDAHILNEGDHLHLTFPGWGKAPTFGGATREGVFNPALVPPPPSGVSLEDSSRWSSE